MEKLTFKRSFKKKIVSDLYGFITYQSRQPLLFKDYQVPDTAQGRFEMLTLHLALLFRRLKLLRKEELPTFSNLTQGLCEWVVADIEESVRAMRVSDLKVTRYTKKLLEGFYGRLIAYDKALESADKKILEQAICRNVYGLVDEVSETAKNGLVSYSFQTWEVFQTRSIPQIMTEFPY